MDSCPRCGGPAEPAGHEDARAFFHCPACDRVWATHILAAAQPALARGAPAPRVLIADDSPEMLGLLAAWLEDEGCVVIAVGSGREALDASAAYRPDVAFLDVVLPPPDGFHVCATLISRGGPAVILMTDLSNPDPRQVRESGALHLLHKPFDRGALVDALTPALAQPRRDHGGGLAAAAAG
jgi:DNA-binding response OmpR family regulator